MERTPLSNKEYFALLALAGADNSYRQYSGDLATRCRSVENGTEDMETLITTMDDLFRKLLDTVPVNKLKALHAELGHARCKLEVVKDVTGKARDKGITYVSVEPLEQLVMHVINDNCTFCDKSTAKSKQCKLLKIINELYVWDMPPKKDGCPLQGEMFNGG